MTRRPSTWGHELERAEAARRRRELVTTFLVAIGIIAGAAFVLVATWLACVGFLVTFG